MPVGFFIKRCSRDAASALGKKEGGRKRANTRLIVLIAIRNKLGGRGDKAILPDADWRERAQCYSTFDGRRPPWKWRNFFRHFLAPGKQITFHSWHLPSVATTVGRIRIRIQLNKEAIWFLLPLYHEFLFSPPLSSRLLRFYFFYIHIFEREPENESIFYAMAFDFVVVTRLICGRRCATSASFEFWISSFLRKDCSSRKFNLSYFKLLKLPFRHARFHTYFLWYLYDRGKMTW